MKNIKSFSQYSLNESFALSSQEEQIVINIAQYILNNHLEKLSNFTYFPNKILKYFNKNVLNLNVLEEDVEKGLSKTNESFEAIDLVIGLVKLVSGVGVIFGTALTIVAIREIFNEILNFLQYRKNMRERRGEVVVPLNMEQDPFGEELNPNGIPPFNYRRIKKLIVSGILVAFCTTPFVIGLTMKMGKSSHDEKGKITKVEQVDLYNVEVKGKNKTYTLQVPYKELSKFKVGDSTNVSGMSEKK